MKQDVPTCIKAALLLGVNQVLTDMVACDAGGNYVWYCIVYPEPQRIDIISPRVELQIVY